jgi:phage gpG-like protein
MPTRPTNFVSPNFSVKVNRWPVIDGRRITRAFGKEAARLIRERISKGRQASGAPLPPYSDIYEAELRRSGASTKRDLSLSGSLVRNIRTLKTGRNYAVVGWNNRSRSPNVIRADGGLLTGRGKGQKHRDIVKRLAAGPPARQILGLTKSDKRRLAKWLRARRAWILRVR